MFHNKRYYPPGVRFTLGFGPTTNFTDIKKNKVFNSFKPVDEWRGVAQATLEYEVTEYLNVRGHLSYAQIAGASNHLRFQADLIETSTTININPILLFENYDGSQRWFPSIILGVGLAHYNSVLVDKQDNEVSSRGFGRGGGLFGYVIEGVAIGGIGLSYAINENWSVRIELANRWMSEDNLDSYISRSPYDFYNFAIASVGYKFFRKNRYPLISTLPPTRRN
ncbi:MAG: hypothetical protein IPM52_04070 [Bacteroidetes bacterium]|nr:hypothetical protein [Bacteroidota bacterium]